MRILPKPRPWLVIASGAKPSRATRGGSSRLLRPAIPRNDAFRADKQPREPIPGQKIRNLHKPLNLFGFGQKNSEINSAKTATEQRENSGGTATHRQQISDKKVTNSGRRPSWIRKQRLPRHGLRPDMYVRVMFTSRGGGYFF
jgi:hypothetical protein